MAKCAPKMDEFKYCMSIKSLHPEEKRAEWIRHRAEYWARKRLTMSSENVWEVRTYVFLPYFSDNFADLYSINKIMHSE